MYKHGIFSFLQGYFNHPELTNLQNPRGEKYCQTSSSSMHTRLNLNGAERSQHNKSKQSGRVQLFFLLLGSLNKQTQKILKR
jgi:hypothetical protein